MSESVVADSSGWTKVSVVHVMMSFCELMTTATIWRQH